MARPLILLSNDDGWNAHGLRVLALELERFADVVVCAPERDQSATSHALTLTTPLRLRRVSERVFALDGTPADCVYVALHSGTKILPGSPTAVVSGMNHGPNLGVDVMYSGTVAAAREAAHRGIPAVAVSADARADAAAAAALGARVVAALLAEIGEGKTEFSSALGTRGADGAPPPPLFNVNVPPGDRWELAATRLGRRRYEDDVVYRRDPRDREYLWIGGSRVRHDTESGTDTAAYEAGLASVTPLELDVFSLAHQPLAEAVARLGRPGP
ncbi:MAG: 5'/3'-nucleotidase SurE [Myxococcales bacterium]|nr:5'/3'-nucleotidase SurE [Myxococcales bacterium]